MQNSIQETLSLSARQPTVHPADSATAPSPLATSQASCAPCPIGRFSTGMELLSGRPGLQRTGRFSTGVEQHHKAAPDQRIGRFSTGIEQTAETRNKRRVGSFATGVTSLIPPDQDSRLAPSALHDAPAASLVPALELRPLIVGFDGSMPSTAALAWAAGTGRPVIVVRVLDPRPLPPGANRADPQLDTNEARVVLGEHAGIAARRLADCAWRAELVEACSPAAGLVASARRHDASGIVVGSRGRSPGRSVVGRQLYQLLTNADVPVVVVPLHASARLIGQPAPSRARRSESMSPVRCRWR